MCVSIHCSMSEARVSRGGVDNYYSYYGVKPLIHQSELRTYYESSAFSRKMFLSLCGIVKITEWNGLIKIDN